MVSFPARCYKTIENQDMKVEQKKPTRHGKHHPDNVILGCFVKPEFKALAMMVAKARSCNVAELLADGIKYHATACGLMENGRVKPEVEIAIRACAEQLRRGRTARRSREALK